jgi:hypothetical protein
MELKNCWEAATCAVTQGFPNSLWNPKVHYGVQKSPKIVLLLIQIFAVHTTLPYLSKFSFNIIRSCLDHPSGLLSSSLLMKTSNAFLFSPIRAKFPSHLIHLDLVNIIILREEYNLRSSSLCLQTPVFGPNTRFSTLLPKTFQSLLLNVRDKVSFPYRTWGTR